MVGQALAALRRARARTSRRPARARTGCCRTAAGALAEAADGGELSAGFADGNARKCAQSVTRSGLARGSRPRALARSRLASDESLDLRAKARSRAPTTTGAAPGLHADRARAAPARARYRARRPKRRCSPGADRSRRRDRAPERRCSRVQPGSASDRRTTPWSRRCVWLSRADRSARTCGAGLQLRQSRSTTGMRCTACAARLEQRRVALVRAATWLRRLGFERASSTRVCARRRAGWRAVRIDDRARSAARPARRADLATRRGQRRVCQRAVARSRR